MSQSSDPGSREQHFFYLGSHASSNGTLSGNLASLGTSGTNHLV